MQLAEENIKFAHWCARRHWKQWGRKMDYEELASCALLGLCEAQKTFDPDKGSFRTYARWVILDRCTKWVMSQRPITIEDASVDVERIEDPEAREVWERVQAGETKAKIAAERGVTKTWVDWRLRRAKLQAQSSLTTHASLTAWWDHEIEVEPLRLHPTGELERRDLGRRMLSALEELPEEHRTLIKRFYFGEETLRAIGKERGLSRQAMHLRLQRAEAALRRRLGVCAST